MSDEIQQNDSLCMVCARQLNLRVSGSPKGLAPCTRCGRQTSGRHNDGGGTVIEYSSPIKPGSPLGVVNEENPDASPVYVPLNLYEIGLLEIIIRKYLVDPEIGPSDVAPHLDNILHLFGRIRADPTDVLLDALEMNVGRKLAERGRLLQKPPDTEGEDPSPRG